MHVKTHMPPLPPELAELFSCHYISRCVRFQRRQCVEDFSGKMDHLQQHKILPATGMSAIDMLLVVYG
jgi:hypothetical protein